jgi:protein SCO1/2
MSPRRRLLVLGVLGAAVALGAGAGAVLHAAVQPAPRPHGLAVPALHGQAVWAAGRRPAPGFALPDQDGRLVSLEAERGRTVVLAFMDPLCRQECPIEGRGLALAEREAGPAARPTLLIVSVNPRATGADAKAAASRWGITGRWHWLLGTKAALARVWRAYDITVVPSSHDIVHSTAVYVIDRHGFERVGVLAPFLPQFVADDLRVLAGGAT